MKIDTDLLDEQCKLAAKIHSWLEYRHHYQPVIEDPILEHIDFSWANDRLYIGASGDRHQLHTLFGCLAFNGFRLPKRAKRPEDHEPEWSGTFEKIVTLEQDPGVPTSITAVKIYVCFTSTVCRVEQVGTEMKEVPIYRVKCGDEITDVPASAPIPF